MNKQSIILLIRRDFQAYKRVILLLSLFILVVSMLITFINTNTLRIFSSGLGNIIMIIIGVFAMEQTDGAIRMHTASLPVSRKEIVFARLISSLVIILVNTLLHFLVFNSIVAIRPEPVFTSLGLLLFAVVYGIFQLSVYSLIFYRFNMIISVIIFIMPAVIWTAVSPGAGFLTDVVPSNPTYLAIFSLVTIGLLFLSFYGSVAYYKKKNL